MSFIENNALDELKFQQRHSDFPSISSWLQAKKCVGELKKFLDASPTQFHVVETASKLLEQAGFRRYEMSELISLSTGDKGYISQNGSALLAFVIGKNPESGWRIFGAHTDSPCLKLKPRPVCPNDGVIRLGVEVYGGPLLATWFDRPLGYAGRVFIENEKGEVESITMRSKAAPLIIPNLAIHLNGEANNGVKIERQKVLLPMLTAAGKVIPTDFFEALLSDDIGVEPDRILSYDLMLYDVAPVCYAGLDDIFISSGRLDNLAMCEAGLYGLTSYGQAKDQIGIAALVLTDNEEVGSRTKQGADSLYIRDQLELIATGAGVSRSEFLVSLGKSVMISADLAHAVHPNYSEMADPNHRPQINCGPVLKVAANQSYATDAKAAALFKRYCQKANAPMQVFVNRSDLRGGSTIGPIASAYLPMTTIDCGTPIWGMHSIRETSGILDHLYMSRVAEAFFHDISDQARR